MESWINKHPNATRKERIAQLATLLIGSAEEPSGADLDWAGLEEDFSIYDEPLETCQMFDEIVMRCNGCDWWTDSDYLSENGYCEDCVADGKDE